MTDDQQTTNVSNEAAQASPLSFEEKVIETIVGVALQSIDGLISVNGRFLSDMTENLENSRKSLLALMWKLAKKRLQLIWK